LSQLKNHKLNIIIYSFLIFILNTGYAFGETRSCLQSASLQRVVCGGNISSQQVFDVKNSNSFFTEPSFIAYRLAVSGSSERKCRFQPSCSQFLLESIKRHGFVKGTRNAFARAQMLHDDQFGTLPIELHDNFLVVLDPVKNWDEK
jgi:hypothetical protein